MSKIRILFIIPTYSDKGAGVTEAARGLAMQLAKNTDLSVMAIALNDAGTQAAMSNWTEIKTYRLGNSGLGFSTMLSRTISEINPNIIHIHGLWLGIGVQAAFWAIRNNVQYFVSTHGMMDRWAWNKSKLRKLIYFYLFQRRVLLNSTILHSLNKEESDSVKDILPNKESIIIPNGICVEDYKSASNNISNTKKLLFLGRLDPKKSVLELVIAWSELLDDGEADGWSLEVAGSGNARYEKLLRKAAGKHLNKGINFKGHVLGAEKIECFRSATAFVLASKSEGLPVVILEAWASSLPVAISKECNLSNSLDLGLSFEVYSEKKKLKKSLGEFIKLDSCELEAMGKNSLRYVSQNYSWGSIAGEFTRLYKKHRYK